MGWLDWDFDRAMNTDCLAISMAMDAKFEMLVKTGVLVAKDKT